MWYGSCYSGMAVSLRGVTGRQGGCDAIFPQVLKLTNLQATCKDTDVSIHFFCPLEGRNTLRIKKLLAIFQHMGGIVLQTPSRFHHFLSGACSGGDHIILCSRGNTKLGTEKGGVDKRATRLPMPRQQFFRGRFRQKHFIWVQHPAGACRAFAVDGMHSDAQGFSLCPSG